MAPPTSMAAAAASTSSSSTPSSNIDNDNRAALIDLTRKVASLGRSGRAELALREVADAVAGPKKVVPDSRLATALIDACGRSSRFDLALAAFDALFGPGAPEGVGPPGEGAMDALLRAALEGGSGGGVGSGSGRDDAEASSTSTSSSSPSPSSSPSSPKRWRDAAIALDRCAAAGLEPTVGAFNVLLACASRNRDVERGYEILKKMKSSNVEPDFGTVAAVKGRRALRSFLKKTFEI